MKSSKLSLSIVDPQPIQVPALLEETYVSNDSTWVRYGVGNEFPDLVHDLLSASATFGTIVKGFVDYICGDGIEVASALKHFETAVNRRGDTIADLVEKVAMDYVVYGGFAIQIIYAKGFNRIAELYALDFKKVRSNKSGSTLWYFYKAGKYTKYQSFDPERASLLEPSQILYYNGGARSTYPHPLYEGGIKDIMTEAACTDYSLNSVTRGFMARHLITFPEAASLSDSQKRAIEKGIREKFCGSNAPTPFVVVWTNGGEATKIDRIEGDDMVERFNANRAAARENIYTAFRATPNLFGLPTATTGFNAQEYAQAFKLFQKTVIAPMQNRIERVFDRLFGVDGAIKIQPFTIKFEE